MCIDFLTFFYQNHQENKQTSPILIRSVKHSGGIMNTNKKREPIKNPTPIKDPSRRNTREDFNDDENFNTDQSKERRSDTSGDTTATNNRVGNR